MDEHMTISTANGRSPMANRERIGDWSQSTWLRVAAAAFARVVKMPPLRAKMSLPGFMTNLKYLWKALERSGRRRTKIPQRPT